VDWTYGRWRFFGAEVTMLSSSPSTKDAERLGAHKFILTKDPEQLKTAAGVLISYWIRFLLHMITTSIWIT
jgi:hypothetical protein